MHTEGHWKEIGIWATARIAQLCKTPSAPERNWKQLWAEAEKAPWKMYGCVSRQDQVTEGVCKALCCSANQDHTHRAAEWGRHWSQPKKERLGRGCCVTQVLHKEALCALPTGTSRGFVLEPQHSCTGGWSSNPIAGAFWILNTPTQILCCFSSNNDIRIIYKVTGWTTQNPAENINWAKGFDFLGGHTDK